MWIRFCPGKRLLFGVEKTIDDNGVALSCTPPARPRSFAIDDVRSAVYGHTLRITKYNFAAIGNFLWIDSTMPLAQSYAVRSCIRAYINFGTASPFWFLMPFVERKESDCLVK